MLGRRGPVQAAFTPPELKELGELARRGRDRRSRPISSSTRRARRELEADRERARRNIELLREYAAATARRASRGGSSCGSSSRRSRSSATDRVEGVEIVRNELVVENGRIVARPTGETELIPAGLVLRSVGYKGVPLPGRAVRRGGGVIPNDGGRVAVPSARTPPAGSSAGRAV